MFLKGLMLIRQVKQKSAIFNGDYCCIISGICKSEAKNLLQNIDLTEKSATL